MLEQRSRRENDDDDEDGDGGRSNDEHAPRPKEGSRPADDVNSENDEEEEDGFLEKHLAGDKTRAHVQFPEVSSSPSE